jgi:predicted enzyme related to lactoylglutathione lyase
MGVTGLGGIFFRARDPEALGRWYADNLGVGGGEWGLWAQEAGPTVFSPFAADSTYFPPDKQFMLNLRVTDLAGLVEALRAKGIEVITNPEWDGPEVGRFARIHDPEGHAVELWEPAS